MSDMIHLSSGQVSFPVRLMALPGSGDIGLDLVYGYSRAVATRPNVLAPASICGLGWDLARHRIITDPGLSTSRTGLRFARMGPAGGQELLRDRDLLSADEDRVGFRMADRPTVKGYLNRRTNTWEIQEDDGTVYIYGDEQLPGTVEYDLGFSNWFGATNNPAREKRLSVAWNLSKIRTPFGQEYVFHYESDEAGVTDTAGENRTYTRATYLTRVIGPGDDELRLSYGERAPFEYTPYHGSQADVYRDRFETRYLDKVRLVSPSGNVLRETQLIYKEGGNTVYLGPDDALRKRLLMAIRRGEAAVATEEPADGDFMFAPDTLLDYWGRTGDGVSPENPQSGSALYGALKTVTGLTGAVQTFDYTTMDGGASARDLALTVSGSEQAYFADEYAVLTSYDEGAGKGILQPVTRAGRWVEGPKFEQTMTKSQYENASISLQDENFAVLFGDNLYLFARDSLSPDKWVTATFPASGSSGPVAGEGFAAITGSGGSRRFTLRALSASEAPVWVETDPEEEVKTVRAAVEKADAVGIDGQDNFLVSAGYTNADGTLSVLLDFLENNGRWNADSELKATRMITTTLSPVRTAAELQVEAGEGFALIKLQYAPSLGTVDTKYLLCSWDGNFRELELRELTDRSRTDNPARQDRVALEPDVAIRAGQISIGSLLSRINGNKKQLPSFTIQSPTKGTFYAPDLCLFETEATGGKSNYNLVQFDPGGETFSELTLAEADAGLPLAAAGQERDAEEADYIMSGGAVYYRDWNATPGATGLWQQVSGVAPGANATGAYFGAGFLVYEEDATVKLYALQQAQATEALSTSGTLLSAGARSFAVSESGTVTLYWFEDGKASGLVSTYPAGAIKSYDGERTTGARYEYSDALGTTSKGAIVREGVPVYNRVIRKSGGAPGTDTPVYDHGRTEHYFYTGPAAGRTGTAVNYAPYPTEHQGDNQYPYNSNDAAGLVTALPYLTQTFDAGDKEESVNQTEYLTYFHPVGNLGAGRYADAGTFSRLSRTTSTHQAITNYLDYDYDDDGRLKTERSRNVDVSGHEQTAETEYTYFDEYGTYRGPAIRSNLSGVVVSRVRRVTTRGSLPDDIINYPSTEVTTFRDWSPELSSGESWAPFKSYRWIKDPKQPGDSATVVAYDAENPDTFVPPEGWELLEAVVERGAGGMPTIGRDTGGVFYSTLYDEATGQTPLAGYSGARFDRDQASYCGFEVYEPPSYNGWVVLGDSTLSAGIRADDSAIGERSYYMAAGASGPRRVLRPDFTGDTEPRAFVFSCFVKSETGYASGAQWTIEAYHDGTLVQGSDLNLAIPATGQRWVYIQQIIDPASIRSAGGLSANAGLDYVINANNAGGAGAVRLDELRFGPVDGSFSAMAYDFDRRRMTASTGTNGEIQRFLQRPSDSTGAVVTNNDGVTPGENERVALQSGASLARLISGGAAPDSNLPDHALKIGAGDRSAYIDFRNERASDWDFTSGTWVFQDGTLACDGAGTAIFDDFVVGAFALRLRIVERAGSVSITTGGPDSFVLTRDDSGWKLDPGGGGSTVTAPATGPARNEDLLFVRLDGLLALYADGRQIFALAADGGQSAGPSKVQIDSASGSAFSDFALTSAPPGSFTLQDGGGRQVQSLSVLGAAEAEGELEAGVRTVVRGSLYDELGRPYVQRRPVTTNLVFANSRLKARTDTYLAAPTGLPVDRSTYLDGTIDAAGIEIIDYGRAYYAKAPMSRPTKSENPRAAAESVDLYTTHMVPHSDANSTVFEDLVGPAPDGKGRYGIGRDYDGTGQEGYGLADQWGRTLFSRIVVGDDKYLTSGKVYDDAGNVIEERPPNYYEPPAGSRAADWITTYSYDMLRGLKLSANSRDRGLTQYMYDSAGRLRFRQDARNAAAGEIVYIKYDRVSRRIENGTVPYAGTWADLQEKANDPTWPSSGNTYKKKFLYDYDLDTPNALYLLGRLRSTSVNNNPATDVEARTYDALGKVREHILSVSDFDAGAAQTTTYTRDQTGRVITIQYPAADGGGSRLTVGYYYDRDGRLASIGDANVDTAPERRRYAAYSYDRMGRIIDETFNGAAASAAQIARTISFNPAGLPVQLDDQYWRETLDYDKSPAPGEDEQYNARINSTSFEYKPERWNCPPSNYGYEFDYDKKLRLTKAKHSTEETGTLVFAADEVNLAGGFDPNGNMLTYRRGLSRRAYSYAAPPAEPGGDPSAPYNRVYTVNATTDARFDPALAEGNRAGDFVWGSSNGGPSGTQVNAPEITVAGASPGRYEYLRLESFLEQRVTYQLTYDIKAGEGFATNSAGQVGWFLRGKTAAGETFEVQLVDSSDAPADFTTKTLSITPSTFAEATSADEPLDDLRIEFRNGRWALAGGPAGAVSLQNVRLTTGTPSVGEPATAVPIGNYDYDPVGATKTAPALALTYDPVLNRTATITRTRDGQTADIALRYGARNQRLRKQVALGGQSGSRWYFHGGRARPLMRLDRDDAGGDPVDGVSYIYGPGGLIAIRGEGGLHFALKDHLGSTRVLVDDAGQVDRYYDYLPYGGLLRTGGKADENNEHRYTSQEKDKETGLYNYRARLYDPDLRRFYAPDPARQTDSPYSYVDDNPISRTDPTGETYGEIAQWIMNPAGQGISRAVGRQVVGTGTALWVVFGLRITYFVITTVGGGILYHPVARNMDDPRPIHAFGLPARGQIKIVFRGVDPTRSVLEVYDRVSIQYLEPEVGVGYNYDFTIARAGHIRGGGAVEPFPRWWLTDLIVTIPAAALWGIAFDPVVEGLAEFQTLPAPFHLAAVAGGLTQVLLTQVVSMAAAPLINALPVWDPLAGVENPSLPRRALGGAVWLYREWRGNMLLFQYLVSQVTSMASTAIEAALYDRAESYVDVDSTGEVTDTGIDPASLSITIIFGLMVLFFFLNNFRIGGDRNRQTFINLDWLTNIFTGGDDDEGGDGDGDGGPPPGTIVELGDLT